MVKLEVKKNIEKRQTNPSWVRLREENKYNYKLVLNEVPLIIQTYYKSQDSLFNLLKEYFEEVITDEVLNTLGKFVPPKEMPYYNLFSLPEGDFSDEKKLVNFFSYLQDSYSWSSGRKTYDELAEKHIDYFRNNKVTNAVQLNMLLDPGFAHHGEEWYPTMKRLHSVTYLKQADNIEYREMVRTLINIKEVKNNSSFDQYENILLKDWKLVNVSPVNGKVNDFELMNFLKLPINTKVYRKYLLDEVTAGDFLTLARKFPKGTAARAGIEVSRNILKEEVKDPHEDLRRANGAFQKMFEISYKEHSSEWFNNAYRYFIDARGQNNLITLLDKHFDTPEDVNAKNLNRTIPNVLSLENCAWARKREHKNFIVGRLLEVLPANDVINVINDVAVEDERLTISQWERYSQNHEDYAGMPVSWWINIIK